MQVYLNFNKNANIIENKQIKLCTVKSCIEYFRTINDNYTVQYSVCLEVSDYKTTDDLNSSRIIVKLKSQVGNFIASSPNNFITYEMILIACLPRTKIRYQIKMVCLAQLTVIPK